MLRADGFDVPAIFYRSPVAAAEKTPRPTLIVGNGYDGAQEEMLHVVGLAALERGIHIITYEGPGQPLVRRKQGLGFIPDWERAVTPVVDYALSLPEVDAKRIGLLGYSMGGWLALRAAAFEHRLAAVLAVDGVFSVFQAYQAMMPPDFRAALDAGDAEKLNAVIKGALDSGKAPTGLRWGVEQGVWSFKAASPADFMEKTKAMTLEGIVHQIACPAWVGEGADDLFFQGQPELVKAALGDRATHVRLTAKDAASSHLPRRRCRAAEPAHL